MAEPRGPGPIAGAEAQPVRAEAELSALLSRELEAPVLPAVSALARELQRRHGSAVSAVVFYGSCLRKRTTEGVLDFYVVVDGYRQAHASRTMALLNAALPPSVFYCEWAHGGETLRTKYAVISLRDLQRGASLRRLDCRIWSRFSQPAALAWVRDDDARRAVTDATLLSCLTFVERAWSSLPETVGVGAAGAGATTLRFTAETLFQTGFRETYRAELRAERPETIRQLYESAPERYEAMARSALGILEARGRLQLRQTQGGFETTVPVADRRRAQLSWRARRPLAKLLAIAGLLKTAFTFGDWVPYVLWKVERQTAVRIELTERQRRHPLIFAWPVIFRVLRDGVYR